MSVELNPQEQMLYQMVKSQLGDSCTFDEAEKNISAVKGLLNLSDEMAQRVIDKFRVDFAPPPVANITPRFLVDWGELPRVGHQVRPEFTLLCPGYASAPEIAVHVDSQLDHELQDPKRRPVSEEPSLWSFTAPFRMTSGGLDCRPGHYEINFEISFRDVPAEMPRFYRSRIRLNVSSDSSQGGVLEIDGDGQSVVNLQGCNLKQFSRVVLKGGQDSIINLAGALGNSDPTSPEVPNKPQTTFEYQLKVDSQKQARMPVLVEGTKRRACLEKCAFFFEDGRRTLVFAKPKLAFGRSRDNDVVIRFLPSNSENDENSRNISRTHFTAELTSEGIELHDESRSGMEVNYSVVRERHVIPAAHAGDVTHVELGVTGTVPQKFELEMLPFAPARHEHRDELEYWDELYCEIVHGRRSRLAREALDVMLNAVRYDRAENLAGEESYVHLLREALFGGSRTQAAILLRECGPQPQARLLHIDRTFWLEPLPGALPITLDGFTLKPRSLNPLAPGMEIQFGSERARFDQPSQLYLDG